jgi:hypothetical protein
MTDVKGNKRGRAMARTGGTNCFSCNDITFLGIYDDMAGTNEVRKRGGFGWGWEFGDLYVDLIFTGTREVLGDDTLIVLITC